MPNATIYIRKENEAKWEAIADKSNWINTLLENSDDTSRYGAVENSPVGPLVPVLSESTPFKEMQPKFCKNGHPIPYGRDKCLGKGCKYS